MKEGSNKNSDRMQNEDRGQNKDEKQSKTGHQMKNDELESNEDTSISSEFERQYRKIGEWIFFESVLTIWILDPVLKTVVIEEQDSKFSELIDSFKHSFLVICFSLKPQKGCPRGTTPILEDAWNRNDNSREQGEVSILQILKKWV